MIKNDILSVSISSDDKNPNFEQYFIGVMEKAQWKFIERKYHHVGKGKIITLMYFEFVGRSDLDFENKI